MCKAMHQVWTVDQDVFNFSFKFRNAMNIVSKNVYNVSTLTVSLKRKATNQNIVWELKMTTFL